jgi:chromosome segregation ATPase
MTIQRWGISFINEEEFKNAGGRYVLYTDHLAALAEKEKEIEHYCQCALKDNQTIAVAHDMLVERQEQIAALQEEINNPKRTYCAWCGFTVEIDDDAGSGIAQHVDTCEKHPLNRKIAALQARIKELESRWCLEANQHTGAIEEIAELQARVVELERALEKIVFILKDSNIDWGIKEIARAALGRKG